MSLLLTCRTSHSSARARRAAARRWRSASIAPLPPPGPTGTAPRPRTHTALTVRTRKPSLSLQIPSCTGEPSVRVGRHGRGNPSSTDALFIRRFSIPGVGRGGGSPVLPLPDPELGRHRSSLFPPYFNPYVWRWDFYLANGRIPPQNKTTGALF